MTASMPRKEFEYGGSCVSREVLLQQCAGPVPLLTQGQHDGYGKECAAPIGAFQSAAVPGDRKREGLLCDGM